LSQACGLFTLRVKITNATWSRASAVQTCIERSELQLASPGALCCGAELWRGTRKHPTTHTRSQTSRFMQARQSFCKASNPTSRSPTSLPNAVLHFQNWGALHTTATHNLASRCQPTSVTNTPPWWSRSDLACVSPNRISTSIGTHRAKAYASTLHTVRFPARLEYRQISMMGGAMLFGIDPPF
jgi:hypothetical protein